MGRRVRYIIKPPGGYEEWRALMARYGLELVERTEQGRKPFTLQEIYMDLERSAAVHYIEDEMVELPFIQVGGPNLDFFARLVETNLPVFTEAELFSTWDEADELEDKIDAILRIGVASDDAPTEPYVSRIRAALEDPAPEVRAAGLVALSYHPWDALKPLVEQIRDGDPDEDAQLRAKVMLDTWDQGVRELAGS